VAPGLANSLSILHNAARSKSPVVVTAGQQDGTETDVDPATLRLSAGDVPYCAVKGGAFEARLSRAAAFQLLALADHDESIGRGTSVAANTRCNEAHEAKDAALMVIRTVTPDAASAARWIHADTPAGHPPRSGQESQKVEPSRLPCFATINIVAREGLSGPTGC
jgi:hypothetical protein